MEDVAFIFLISVSLSALCDLSSLPPAVQKQSRPGIFKCAHCFLSRIGPDVGAKLVIV